jgi:hypothetical protein
MAVGLIRAHEDRLCGKATPPGEGRRQLFAARSDLTQEETFMTPLAIPSTIAAALPTANIQPHGHGHGHKKGMDLDATSGASSTSSTSGTPGQPASTPNLFSSLFDSLAQVLGAQPAQATQAARVTQPAQPAQSAQAAQLAIGSKVNTTA